MVTRKDREDPDKGGSAGFHQAVFTLEGTPLKVDVNMRRDASPHVSFLVTGLAHPHLPDEAVDYMGAGSRDPRLEPLAARFADELERQMQLSEKPITKGLLRKPVEVERLPLITTGVDTLTFQFGLKGVDYADTKTKTRLYERMAEAVQTLAPAWERIAQQALEKPLAERNVMGENVAQEVERRRKEALTGLSMEADLASAIEKKHPLPPGEALKIAQTAISHLRERGLVRRPGGMDRGESNN